MDSDSEEDMWVNKNHQTYELNSESSNYETD